MRRRIQMTLVLTVALGAAAIASLIVYRALSTREAAQAPRTVATVVAARALPLGALVTREDLRIVAWPDGSAVSGALGSVEDAADRGLIAPVVENEPITESKLAPRGAGTGLGPAIPSGMRAISVRVDEVIAVAGFISPGAQVDVVAIMQHRDANMARVIVSNARVLAVGARTDADASDAARRPATVATLLVTPEDADRIALAGAGGRLMLTLRHPWDAVRTEDAGVSIAQLAAMSSPERVGTAGAEPESERVQPIAAPPPPPPPSPPSLPLPSPLVYTVEAIRGSARGQETVP